MVVCHVEARRANGIHKLPDAINYLRNNFLWNWFRAIWQTAKNRNLLCGCRCMDLPDYFLQYLASILFIWTIGVGMAEPYLLEEATLCKKLTVLSISKTLLSVLCVIPCVLCGVFFTTKNTRKYTKDTMDF